LLANTRVPEGVESFRDFLFEISDTLNCILNCVSCSREYPFCATHSLSINSKTYVWRRKIGKAATAGGNAQKNNVIM